MNLYLDTSALVKLYIREQGSDDVSRWINQAGFTATSLVTLAEAYAAFARAVRMKYISPQTGEEAMRLLRRQWPLYLKTTITEKTVTHAAELAWVFGLRSYDAIHLASAELLQTALGSPVVLATYDRQLAAAGAQAGLDILPEIPA